MAREKHIDFVLEGGILNQRIKEAGLGAARVILPNYDWKEIRERWQMASAHTRTAALVLRRNQLTQGVNLVMATELLTHYMEEAEELEINTSGQTRIIPSSRAIWNNNLYKE